jgi:hypothetical protein
VSSVATRSFHTYLKTLNIFYSLSNILELKELDTTEAADLFLFLQGFLSLKLKRFLYEVREAASWRVGIWKINYK